MKSWKNTHPQNCLRNTQIDFFPWPTVYTAKWIWDSSIFSSIMPKHDQRSFFYFCVFPHSYLFCTENCFILMFRTIYGAKQVRTGKNRKVYKQPLAMFWLIEENLELSHTHLAVHITKSAMLPFLKWTNFNDVINMIDGTNCVRLHAYLLCVYSCLNAFFSFLVFVFVLY